MPDDLSAYGAGDTTYLAAGGEPGIRKLVNDFYDIMSREQRFDTIFGMHPNTGEQSRDKLTLFLCGWAGGPRSYSEKYGPISIPNAHAHLKVGPSERDQWLLCMSEALAKQAYPSDLKRYLIKQLSIPAERIVSAQLPR